MITPRCPVRGHDHDLTHCRALQPVNESAPAADWWECSQNHNRWFLLRSFLTAGRLEMLSKMAMPRYGWASVDKKFDKLDRELTELDGMPRDKTQLP